MNSDQADTTSRPVARIVGGPPRSAKVPLTWPVEFDGRRYDAIVVRRLSTKEVGEFSEAVQGDDEAHLPMFEDGDGNPVPREVLDALDHDDTAAVNEKARDFLPRVFRGDQPTGSDPLTGDPQQPS